METSASDAAVYERAWSYQTEKGIYNRRKSFICLFFFFISPIEDGSNVLLKVFPPAVYPYHPLTSVTPKFVHASVNKMRHPVNLVRWTPEGRRILGASSSGEFTLWNGMSFNFETIMQAHDQSIRAGEWSHNDDWFLSGDQEGLVKYWQPNMNNVKVLAAHREAVRDISYVATFQTGVINFLLTRESLTDFRLPTLNLSLLVTTVL